MLDNKSSPTAPTIFYRRDYTPPDWLVPEVHLDFRFAAEKTVDAHMDAGDLIVTLPDNSHLVETEV